MLVISLIDVLFCSFRNSKLTHLLQDSLGNLFYKVSEFSSFY